MGSCCRSVRRYLSCVDQVTFARFSIGLLCAGGDAVVAGEPFEDIAGMFNALAFEGAAGFHVLFVYRHLFRTREGDSFDDASDNHRISCLFIPLSVMHDQYDVHCEEKDEE